MNCGTGLAVEDSAAASASARVIENIMKELSWVVEEKSVIWWDFSRKEWI